MATVAQSFLAIVFVGAAIAKAVDHGAFLRTLASIPWLPLPLARLAARAVPLIEFALGLAFLAVPALAAGIAIGVLAIFSTVAVVEIGSGREFRCGCFGVTAARTSAWTLVVRNVLLAATATTVVLGPETNEFGAVLVGVGFGFALLLVQIGGETLGIVRR